MQNKKFTLKIPSTHVIQTNGTVLETDQFEADVSYTAPGGAGNEYAVAYYWDLTVDAISRFGFTSLTPIDYVLVSGRPVRVDLEFYTYQTDVDNPIITADIRLLTDDPTAQSASGLLTSIQGATSFVENENFQGNEKKLRTITLSTDYTDDLCVALKAAMDGPDRSFFALGVIKSSTSSNGSMKIGGQTLAYGIDSGWNFAYENEIFGPPNLVIYIENTPSDNVQQIMHYTSSDCYSSQSNPIESLGGFISTNAIYSRGQIADSTTTSQTSLTISSHSQSVLPSEGAGLAQCGPEIFSYSLVQSTSRTLLGLQRGLTPYLRSASGSINPFAETVNYLPTDSLFANKPISGLDQYRCIAIKHRPSGGSLDLNVGPTTAYGIKIYLIQNSFNDVQIDVGIEVPSHGPYSETLLYDANEGDTSIIITALLSNYDSSELPDDFCVGSCILIDLFATTIVSYTVSAGEATIVISDPLDADYLSTTSVFIENAPSQTVINETTPPVRSNYFFGFLGDGGSNDLSYQNIHERLGDMTDNDIFYLWVKRTMTNNKTRNSDAGAIVMITFNN